MRDKSRLRDFAIDRVIRSCLCKLVWPHSLLTVTHDTVAAAS